MIPPAPTNPEIKPSAARDEATAFTAPPLTLHPVLGPPIDPIELPVGRGTILGRGSASDRLLPDPAVSRRHARVVERAGRWMITDLGSRHGTMVNGVAVEPSAAVPIHVGDTVGIGPWVFSVGTDLTVSSPLTTTVESDSSVAFVDDRELHDPAGARLEALIRCLSTLQDANDERAVAQAVVDALITGTGYQRAAVVRPARGVEQVDVLAAAPDAGTTAITLSRSLLREATSTARMVRLSETPQLQDAVSIVELGIASAICAPVILGGQTRLLLYADTRSPQGLAPAAAPFAHGVAQVAALVLARQQHAELQRRQRELDAELSAARSVQRRIMPAENGDVGPIAYAMRSLPGRVVAGDLFDAVRVSDRRGVVFLGDVTGKGLGAAMLMAMAQSRLRASVEAATPVDHAITDLNAFVANRSADHEFLSLIAAVYDHDEGGLALVDAGHGYAIIVRGGEHEPTPLRLEGDILLGIEPDAAYRLERTRLAPEDRLVLFSDGVVEQTDPSGEQFGVERCVDALSASAGCRSDVDAVIEAVERHAAGSPRGDDVTVASVSLRA